MTPITAFGGPENVTVPMSPGRKIFLLSSSWWTEICQDKNLLPSLWNLQRESHKYTEPHWWHGWLCTDLPRQWCCFVMSLTNMRFGWPSSLSYNWRKQTCERTEVTQRHFKTASPYILDILTVNFKMHLYSKGLAFLLHTTKVTYIVQEKKNHTTLLWSIWVKHLFPFHCGFFLTSFQEIICA